MTYNGTPVNLEACARDDALLDMFGSGPRLTAVDLSDIELMVFLDAWARDVTPEEVHEMNTDLALARIEAGKRAIRRSSGSGQLTVLLWVLVIASVGAADLLGLVDVVNGYRSLWELVYSVPGRVYEVFHSVVSWVFSRL